MKKFKKLATLAIIFSFTLTSLSTTSALADDNQQTTTSYFGIYKEEKYTVREQTGTMCTGSAKKGNKKCTPIYSDVEKTRNVFIDKSNEIMSENSWANLEKVSAKNLELEYNDRYEAVGTKESTFQIPLPKYVLNSEETAIKDYPHHFLPGYGGMGWYNFGINPKWTGCSTAITSLKLNNDGTLKYGPKNDIDIFVNDMKRYYTIPKSGNSNPYKFTQNDILTRDEVKDAVNLRFKADIKKKDSTDSKKIDELNAGDTLDLDCKINADWFKRLFNFQILGYHRVGGGANVGSEGYSYNEPNCYIKDDAGIAFALYLPKGVEIDKNSKKVELSGLDGFTATIEKKEDTLGDQSVFSKFIKEKNGEKQDVLLVTVRKNEKGVTKTEREIVEKVKKLNIENINLKISGLKVSKEVEPGNHTIFASVGGFYDFAISPQENFYTYGPDHQGTEDNNKPADRFYWTFAAVQDPNGLDDALKNQKKPNIISYTFNVKSGKVLYRFVSGTEGKDLPKEVIDLLPTDNNNYSAGVTVSPIRPSKNEITVGNDKWTFKGYDRNELTLSEGENKFTGTWEWKDARKEATATYEFVSNTKEKQLPEEVTKQKPKDETNKVGEKVTAKTPTQTEITVGNDKWTFKGYDRNELTLSEGENKFTGTWSCTTTIGASKINHVPILKVKDAEITVGEILDLKGLIVSATDKEDGDLKDKVEIVDKGGFDNNKVGTYRITYKVTDSKGATATKTATVIVKEKEAPKSKQISNQKNKKENNTRKPEQKNSSKKTEFLAKTGLNSENKNTVVFTISSILLVLYILRKKQK